MTVVQQQSIAAHEAMKRLRWDRIEPHAVWREWQLYLLDGMDRWAVWVDAERHVVACSTSTWETICHHGPAQNQFQSEMTADDVTSGMRFLVADNGLYLVAAQAEAQRQRTDIVKGKDAISDLSERLDDFVLSLASRSVPVSRYEIEMFTRQQGGLQSEMLALEIRMRRLRAAFDLASAAVGEAVSA